MVDIFVCISFLAMLSCWVPWFILVLVWSLLDYCFLSMFLLALWLKYKGLLLFLSFYFILFFFNFIRKVLITLFLFLFLAFEHLILFSGLNFNITHDFLWDLDLSLTTHFFSFSQHAGHIGGFRALPHFVEDCFLQNTWFRPLGFYSLLSCVFPAYWMIVLNHFFCYLVQFRQRPTIQGGKNHKPKDKKRRN